MEYSLIANSLEKPLNVPPLLVIEAEESYKELTGRDDVEIGYYLLDPTDGMVWLSLYKFKKKLAWAWRAHAFVYSNDEDLWKRLGEVGSVAGYLYKPGYVINSDMTIFDKVYQGIGSPRRAIRVVLCRLLGDDWSIANLDLRFLEKINSPAEGMPLTPIGPWEYDYPSPFLQPTFDSPFLPPDRPRCCGDFFLGLPVLP